MLSVIERFGVNPLCAWCLRAKRVGLIHARIACINTLPGTNRTVIQWRIHDLQTGGAKVERRRREYRGAETVGRGEGVSPCPLGEAAVPPPQKIFLTRSKNVDF